MVFPSTGGSDFLIDGGGRVYPMLEPGKRNLFVAYIVVQCLVMIGVMTYLVVVRHIPVLAALLVITMSMASSGYIIGLFMTSVTVLYRDRIEVRNLFSRRSLRKADIASRSLELTPKSGDLIVLTPKPGCGKTMQLSQRPDDTGFNAWFRDIPMPGGAST